jgi:putative oxidoreductase
MSPLFLSAGFAFIRIVSGALMIYHGLEVFNGDKMSGYGNWLRDLRFPVPVAMAWLGKGSELVGGILLAVGLFTRTAALLLTITMLVVCFGLGNGRIFTDDQHPFLFALLTAIFFFTGGGKWSIDHLIFGR